MISPDILYDTDENLGAAVQSGFKRTRSWRVPPNWLPCDWYEELAAVGTAAVWEAVCDFDPERGVPLAGFGYCRFINRCLARYRKEWRYALHNDSSDSWEEETPTFKQLDLAASSEAKADETHRSNNDLRDAVGALPTEQRRLIEQLFWEEHTETEVAGAMGTNQSTINRRKQAILKRLRNNFFRPAALVKSRAPDRAFRRRIARQLAPIALALVVSSVHAEVDPLGHFTHEVKIEVPAFRGLTPQVTLRYSSGAGNGFTGVGWNLDVGPTIARVSATHGVPHFDATDRYLLDGEELIPCGASSTSPSCTTAITAFGSSDGFFSTRVENFTRIRHDPQTRTDAGDWTVWERDGIQLTLHSLDENKTYLLTTITDTHGNIVHYGYIAANNASYLDTINYAGKGTAPGANVRFVREGRPDIIEGLGSRFTIQYRLARIEVNMDGHMARTYELTYTQSLANGSSILASIQQFGSDATVSGGRMVAGATPPLPPTTITTPSMQGGVTVDSPVWVTRSGLTDSSDPHVPGYEPSFAQFAVPHSDIVVYDGRNDKEYSRAHGDVVGDFNGDGRADWIGWTLTEDGHIELHTIISNRNGHAPTIDSSIPGFFGHVRTGGDLWIVPDARIWAADVDGDGRDDLLVAQENERDRHTYAPTVTKLISGGDGQFSRLPKVDCPGLMSDDCVIGDFDGDGRADFAYTVTEPNGKVQLYIRRSMPGAGWDLTIDPLKDLRVESNWDPARKARKFQPSHLITSGDFNADGLTDITIANTYIGPLALLAGTSNGTGGFSWRFQVVTNWPYASEDTSPKVERDSLVSADFDGDGRSDVMFIRANSGLGGRRNDWVYIGLSAKGATDSGWRYRVKELLNTPHHIGTGDFDGDGKTDLLLAGNQTWAQGHGDGTFDFLTTGPGRLTGCEFTDTSEPTVLAADLNGDGRSDILCSCGDLTSGPFILSDRRTPPGLIGADPQRWIQADVTGDGVADLVYITHLNPGYSITVVDMAAQTRKPTFDVGPSATVPGLNEPDTGRFIAMDVGSPAGGPDGKADLVLVDKDNTGTLRVYTLLSNGDGTFKVVLDYPWVNANHGPEEFGPDDLQNWRPADLDGDGNGDLIHLVSLSPGVLVQYLRSRGDGKWDSSKASLPAGTNRYFESTNPLTLPAAQDFLTVDINGDGRTDLVYPEAGVLPAGSIRTLLGKGDGTFLERFVVPTGGFYHDMHRVKIADLNGDGLADLVHVAAVAGASNTLDLRMDAFLSQGNGSWVRRDMEVAPTDTSTNPEDRDLLEDTNLVRFMDVDGDGRSDLVHLSTYVVDASDKPASALLVAHNPGSTPLFWTNHLTKGLTFTNYNLDPWRWQPYVDRKTGNSGLLYVHPDQSQAVVFRSPTDRITRLTNGLGGATQVNYEPLIGHRAYLPEGSLPQVIRSVEVRDESYSPAVSETLWYFYSGARYSPGLSRMLGFEDVIRSDHNSIQETTMTMDDRCGARPSELVTMSLAGAVYSSSSFGYFPIETSAIAPYNCEQNLREDYEGDDTYTNSRLARHEELVQDVYGNVTSRLERADKAVTHRTLHVFAPLSAAAATSYIVDKPMSVVTKDYDGTNWILKSRSTFEYDGNSVAAGPGGVGELRAVNAYDKPGHSVQTKYEYYPQGQLKTTTDPKGQLSTLTYDNTYGLYPATICTGPPSGQLCQTLNVDMITGQILSISDPNPNSATKMIYDAHGRLTLTTRPDDSFTRINYLDFGVVTGSPSGRQRVRTEISDRSTGDNVLWSETFFDGLGRTYRTTREGGATQDTHFEDASSLPQKVSDVYKAGDAPTDWTTYQYDSLDRTLSTFASDNTERQSIFLVGHTIGVDQLGHRKTAYTDGRGQVIRIEEPPATAGANGANTQYKRDGVGRLVGITDYLGNKTTITYDLLGRQTSTQDPDRGLTTFKYFDNGLLDKSTDVLNQVIKFDYDALGRRQQRDDMDDRGQVLRTVKWTWDRDAAGMPAGASLGRLVTMEDRPAAAATPSLTDSYHYDLLGRIDESHRCIDGACVGLRTDYDLAGRLMLLTYPDSTGALTGASEKVDYTYDDAGRLNKVGPYFQAWDYNLNDQLTGFTYGNGLNNTINYDPKRHWIDSITAQPLTIRGQPIKPAIYVATYQHDFTGRIHDLKWDFSPPLRKIPPTPPTTEIDLGYVYDDLGRLIRVDSPDPAHREEFHYDEIGRMSYNSRIDDIHYDDPLHVHAPTKADRAPGPHDRTYDILGNLRNLRDPAKKLDLKWTVDGRVSSITDVTAANGNKTSFTYDPDGTRLKKDSASGTNLYFGPFIERVGNRFITYYWAGDRLIARKDGTAVSYYTQDHAHSTRLVTDNNGKVMNRYDYAPFGLGLASQETAPQEFEFVGDRKDDETGLVYMNARYYDPELMHFVSADTIVPRPSDPKSLHRYSFAQQDPINFWDPSGHLPLRVEFRKQQLEESRVGLILFYKFLLGYSVSPDLLSLSQRQAAAIAQRIQQLRDAQTASLQTSANAVVATLDSAPPPPTAEAPEVANGEAPSPEQIAFDAQMIGANASNGKFYTAVPAETTTAADAGVEVPKTIPDYRPPEDAAKSKEDEENFLSRLFNSIDWTHRAAEGVEAVETLHKGAAPKTAKSEREFLELETRKIGIESTPPLSDSLGEVYRKVKAFSGGDEQPKQTDKPVVKPAKLKEWQNK